MILQVAKYLPWGYKWPTLPDTPVLCRTGPYNPVTWKEKYKGIHLLQPLSSGTSVSGGSMFSWPEGKSIAVAIRRGAANENDWRKNKTNVKRGLMKSLDKCKRWVTTTDCPSDTCSQASIRETARYSTASSKTEPSKTIQLFQQWHTNSTPSPWCRNCVMALFLSGGSCTLQGFWPLLQASY